MPTLEEHKTVQARILGYAFGSAVATRDAPQPRCSSDQDVPISDKAKSQLPFLCGLLGTKVRQLNPLSVQVDEVLLWCLQRHRIGTSNRLVCTETLQEHIICFFEGLLMKPMPEQTTDGFLIGYPGSESPKLDLIRIA
jgi:hypothetical protein